MFPSNCLTIHKTGEISLWVKVIPNARKNSIAGWEDPYVKITIKQPPTKGRANAELLSFLRSLLKIPHYDIAIKKGATSQYKQILLRGCDPSFLVQKLSQEMQNA